MTIAVLEVVTGIRLTTTRFSLSAPKSLRERITETARHQNIQCDWALDANICNISPCTPICLYTLLSWIEASGWKIKTCMSTNQASHVYVFESS